MVAMAWATGGLTLAAAGLPHQHFFTCQEEIIMEGRPAKGPALSKPKQPLKCFIIRMLFPPFENKNGTRMDRSREGTRSQLRWPGRGREGREMRVFLEGTRAGPARGIRGEGMAEATPLSRRAVR